MAAVMCQYPGLEAITCKGCCDIKLGCARMRKPPAGLSATAIEILTEGRVKLDAAAGITNSPLAVQVGGNHYKTMKIQPVEFMHANNLSYIQGAAIKYICRHAQKNGAEDVKKAIHYLQLELQLQYGIKSTFTTEEATDGTGTTSSSK